VRANVLEDGLLGGLMKERNCSFDSLLAEIQVNWGIADAVGGSDVGPWRRGGSETYIARSRIDVASGDTIEVLGKAFVRWGLPPEEQQRQWEERRSLFQMSGIPVPPLFARYPALSIEAYIPDEFPPADLLSEALAFQLGQIARRLRDLGLAPLAPLADLRCLKGKVFYVDLGSDLGSRLQGGSSEWLETLERKLSAPAQKWFRDGFGASISPQRH
jgi:hypothetical protein